jgi:hypothetical protein
MFSVNRFPGLLALFAIGFSGTVIAQSASPASTQQNPTGSGMDTESTSPHAVQLDSQHRVITAGGFVKSGPVIFEDISKKAGLATWTHKMGTPAKDYIIETKGSGVCLLDYDNDGWLDIYVVNGSTVDALTGKEAPPHAALFHNNHDGTFTDVSEKAGVTNGRWGFGCAVADYDNDGWPDLFVTSYYVSVDESVRSYLGLSPNAETLKLYRNLGNGTFRDVTAEAGLDRVLMPMGANFGDIDNDGFLDIYLGTGNPSYASLLPNVLLHNKDGKIFTDVTASSGTGELHKGHGVAFADLDNDGDEDLLTEIGGAVPGDSHAFRLFENPGNGNDWISLHLIGVKTNRAAIGARIKVTVQNEDKTMRSIYRTVGSGGSFGASPLTQHIGLGKSARILGLEIWWPASNTRQTFSNVAVNQFLEVKEFAKDYATLVRHAFRLGGPARSAETSSKQTTTAAGKN